MEGSVDLGSCDQVEWIKTVRPVLEKRMSSYTADEIHFNLLAIVGDRKKLYEKEISSLEVRKELAAQKIQTLLGEEGEAMEGDSELPNDPEALQTVIEEIEAKVFSLQGSIAQEEAKMEKYKIENIRRRHNYLPLIMEILKLLAKRGQLVPLCEEAKKKKEARKEQTKKEETTTETS